VNRRNYDDGDSDYDLGCKRIDIHFREGVSTG
jgi:hypothetical protein